MRQHLLTITVLLLTLPTHTSAQNRSYKEALQGIGEIGVIVRCAQTDGLPEAMRPTIIPTLQDRARDLLTQGQVPLLQSTNEADMAGRPRLVFTVTFNKETATAPPLYVESRLYDRVRLWRDPTKEMELVTWWWAARGRHPVDYRELFAAFDQQVKAFVTDYRAMNPNPLPGQSRTSEPSAQFRDNGNPLEGLNGIDLYVSFSPSQSVRARSNELTRMFEFEAEKKLTQAGIPLLRYFKNTQPADRPLLHISISVNEPGYHSPAIAIESKFRERVRPLRDPPRMNIMFALTWESYASDGWPISDDAIVRVLNSQLDAFIRAYKEANPKLTRARN